MTEKTEIRNAIAIGMSHGVRAGEASLLEKVLPRRAFGVGSRGLLQLYHGLSGNFHDKTNGEKSNSKPVVNECYTRITKPRTSQNNNPEAPSSSTCSAEVSQQSLSNQVQLLCPDRCLDENPLS